MTDKGPIRPDSGDTSPVRPMQSLDGSGLLTLEGQPIKQNTDNAGSRIYGGVHCKFMATVARRNGTPIHDSHCSASKSADQPITTNINLTYATTMTGGDQHLVPRYHSTHYTTAVHRSSVFPDGQHVAHPAVRSATSVQPILIPLPRCVSPNNLVAKSQQSSHTSARNELTYYGANKFKFTTEPTDAYIFHIGTIHTTKTTLNPRAKQQRAITTWASVHIPRRRRTIVITTQIQYRRKSCDPHANSLGGEWHDSNNITMPETSRIVSMNTKRGWIPLSLPTCNHTTTDQSMEKEQTTGHIHKVSQLEQKRKGETAKAGAAKVGNYPRKEDVDIRPTTVVRVHNWQRLPSGRHLVGKLANKKGNIEPQ
ncbi:unnamed protein product [Lactuca virosa]|uniref:Uncharacterized protein n=1 Tax=Lactuca virosa TaxID=75947 RepID=A0AAU9M5I6_9ASTR|nr:unnamed protein product [Lactuca virosa]